MLPHVVQAAALAGALSDAYAKDYELLYLIETDQARPGRKGSDGELADMLAPVFCAPLRISPLKWWLSAHCQDIRAVPWRPSDPGILPSIKTQAAMRGLIGLIN